ncbi:MAG: hypothetical protein QM831_24285 [Kofleriaceae bacterium]
MADLPVKLGTMEGLPPGMRYRVRDVMQMLAGGSFDGVPAERLSRLLDDGEPYLGADPSLAQVGYWMIDPARPVELRRRGAIWLTMFPSAETATRLAATVLDPATPHPVREQATWSLGYRQLRALHPSTLWSPEAIQIADEALVRLADAATQAGKIVSEQLPFALRHVQWEGAFATFARAPGLWGQALESFASPALARVVLVCLEDIPAQHRLRAVRLVAATLGEEAVPMLLARVASAGLSEKLEMLFLLITLGGEGKLGLLEDTIKGMQFVDLLRQRAKWHLKNPGVVPTVRGLRIARSTAVMPIADRTKATQQAADDLGVLTKFARHPEAYLYRLWGWMVRGAADPVRARELVAAHPESQRLVRDLYMTDLARRGRVKQLTAAAQVLQGADTGAMQLAIWGRPLAALELAATARLQTPELVFARALACYRAGRPDLTERILAEDLPPAEIVDDHELPKFPGPHEQWLMQRGAPAISALAAGMPGVLADAKPAPFDAEPDATTLDPLDAVTRRLGRGLPGSTVYLAGEFTTRDKAKIAAAVEAAGARLVAGPFPGTDYYVHGDTCLVQTIAQLERQGARRLRPGEVEGI